MALRIIFMGTPDFSVPTLMALQNAGHEIVACYSQPPRPAGRRGLELVNSSVHQAAQGLGIDVFTPQSLKDVEEQRRLRDLQADVLVVVAYGLLLPQAVLDTPKLGCFNGHASLLPRWRGAAPIQRAIMAGDDQTGMMIMKMDAGLDTGPVALTQQVPITTDSTAGSLHDVLAGVGAELMVDAMGLLEGGQLQLTPQSEDGVTYAAKINKSEARINWSKPHNEVLRHIMGLSPFPGAWCEIDFGKKVERVKILQAKSSSGGEAVGEALAPPGTVLDDDLTIACQTGSIQPTQLQRAGSKALGHRDFLRGNPISTGFRLS